MHTIATVSFSIQPFEKTHSITPHVNGASLVDMVSTFERELGFDPICGYGGLVPGYFKYGPLDRYFLGDFEPNSYFSNWGKVYLLGCNCGEVGCWPLTAHIATEGDSVEWTAFGRDHRPERDYSAFGPFVFAADQYRQAAAALLDEFSALVKD